MFVETITLPVPEWERFAATTELLTDPPAGLVALVCYEEGPEDVTVVNVWASPAARGDFAVERVMPRFEPDELSRSPDRRTPVHTYVRGEVAGSVT